ncbi:MAG: GIY-YIG nuclease family protein [Patescibacteria group bacterium]|nr:GIY-YIG nuclease family protein [Patescibacteria group bacterium]MDD5554872.1 GIY-YIG nuclease family protein [Patescibacteria group bacterium]
MVCLKSIKKGWYYVGSINGLYGRIREHNKGLVKSTKIYKPFIPIFKKEFFTEKEARFYEKKLKQCRIEKEKIINEFRKSIKK